MTLSDTHSEIVLYTTPDGTIKIDTLFQDETIWLTQAKMAELFDVKRPAITKHLKKIFDEGELEEKVVSSILEHTTQHGAIVGKTQTRLIKYYNLDVIIAVGYRVNSKKAEAIEADGEDFKQLEKIIEKLKIENQDTSDE